MLLNVPDEMLIQRVVGRRLDPDTGDIYHLDFSPPPAEIVGRLVSGLEENLNSPIPVLRADRNQLL